MTPEEEAVLRDLAEMNVEYIGNEWAVACLKVFGLLDAVRTERDKRESLLKAYEAAVGDINMARDLKAQTAVLREALENGAIRLAWGGIEYHAVPEAQALAALDRLKEE